MDGNEIGGEEEYQPNCCGMYELGSLYSETNKQLKNELLNLGPYSFCYCIFSNTQDFTSARRLAKMIRDNKLGKVTRLPDRMNPNTHNKLCMYVWMVNWKAMKRWAKKNGVDYEAEGYDDCF